MRYLPALLVLLALSTAPAGATALSGSQACDAVFQIRFNDPDAPSSFGQTQPLTTEYYPSEGITFIGPAPGQGGAELNGQSGYAIPGHSPPNVLAFNAATYATGPETIVFFGPVNYAGVNAGLRGDIFDAGTFTFECFDEDEQPLGSVTAAGSPVLQELEVARPGIVSCTFSFTSQTAVIDDLTYIPCDPTLGGGDYAIEAPTLDLPRLALFAALVLAAALFLLSKRGLP